MKFYAVKAGRKTGIFESWDECSKSVHGYPGAIYKSFKTYSEASSFLGAAAQKEDAAKDASEITGASKRGTAKDESTRNEASKNDTAKDESARKEASKNDTAKDEAAINKTSKDDAAKDGSEINQPSKGERTEADMSGNNLSEDDLPEDEEEEFQKPGRKKRRFPDIRDHVLIGRVDEYVLTESAKAYVDGSYLESTGEFSYGCVVLFGDTEFRFYEKMTDAELASMHNVAGEIKGAEAAMRFAVANGIADLTIYHDYEGIARWCTGEWTARKSGTIAYSNFYQNLPKDLRVRFVKVQGHSGDTYNELADRLAKFALGITE